MTRRAGLLLALSTAALVICPAGAGAAEREQVRLFALSAFTGSGTYVLDMEFGGDLIHHFEQRFSWRLRSKARKEASWKTLPTVAIPTRSRAMHTRLPMALTVEAEAATTYYDGVADEIVVNTCTAAALTTRVRGRLTVSATRRLVAKPFSSLNTGQMDCTDESSEAFLEWPSGSHDWFTESLRLVHKLSGAELSARRLELRIDVPGSRINDCADLPFTAPLCLESLAVAGSLTLLKTCADGHGYRVDDRFRCDRPLRMAPNPRR